MSAITAATELNRVIAAATTLRVVLGEMRLTARQSQEPQRPFFRLVYQIMGDPAHVPSRRTGTLSIYCYGRSQEEAWKWATELTDALGLGNSATDCLHPGLTPPLHGYSLAKPWERLPDPEGGGLVYCDVDFTYSI